MATLIATPVVHAAPSAGVKDPEEKKKGPTRVSPKRAWRASTRRRRRRAPPPSGTAFPLVVLNHGTSRRAPAGGAAQRTGVRRGCTSAA